MADWEVPTRDNIYFGVGNVMDHEHAVKNYCGLTLAEAESRFRERNFNYLEDLYYMGPRAFQFYLRALLNYLESPDSSGDDMAWSFLQGLIKQRASKLEPDFGLPVAVEALRYILDNERKFVDDEHPYTYDPRDLLKALEGTRVV